MPKPQKINDPSLLTPSTDYTYSLLSPQHPTQLTKQTPTSMKGYAPSHTQMQWHQYKPVEQKPGHQKRHTLLTSTLHSQMRHAPMSLSLNNLNYTPIPAAPLQPQPSPIPELPAELESQPVSISKDQRPTTAAALSEKVPLHRHQEQQQQQQQSKPHKSHKSRPSVSIQSLPSELKGLHLASNTDTEIDLLEPEEPQHEFQEPVPIASLNRTAAPVDCPICRSREMTTVEYKAGNTTHAWGLGLCCFTGVLCCVPYLMDSTKDAIHRCGACGKMLATWHKSGKVDVHAYA